jgi:cation transport regulator ChaC
MKTFGLFFLLSLSQLSFAVVCHPKINSRVPQYIVGYGSLMDEQSKKNTDPTAQKSIPVLIKGYKRSWSVHGNSPGLNATFLSVSRDPRSSINGIIYRLSHPKHIAKYDRREISYCRRELEPHQVQLYSATLPHHKQIWIYISDKTPHFYPNKDFPIVQSYVDIFIRGCIQIEEQYKIKNFAKDCIQSTEQWSDHWVNDRIFPRRPFLYEPFASKIDALLKKTQPEKFKQIKIE